MKRLIGLVASVAIGLCNAEAQVGGCYVDVTLPGQCWNYGFSCYVSQSDNLYFYGSAVGGLCNQVDNLEQTVAWKNGLLSTAEAALNQVVGQRDAAQYDRQVLLGVNAYQASLIKKLKKKCGKVCKKVK